MRIYVNCNARYLLVQLPVSGSMHFGFNTRPDALLVSGVEKSSAFSRRDIRCLTAHSKYSEYSRVYIVALM